MSRGKTGYWPNVIVTPEPDGRTQIVRVRTSSARWRVIDRLMEDMRRLVQAAAVLDASGGRLRVGGTLAGKVERIEEELEQMGLLVDRMVSLLTVAVLEADLEERKGEDQ